MSMIQIIQDMRVKMKTEFNFNSDEIVEMHLPRGAWFKLLREVYDLIRPSPVTFEISNEITLNSPGGLIVIKYKETP